jgi:hypothetical protein
MQYWQTTRFEVPLTRPQVMGIVNVTPDSFSDGGRHDDPKAALAHCERLLRDGAHLLDIGGESTRPGSPPVPLEVELARVLPIVREAVRPGRAGLGGHLQARRDAGRAGPGRRRHQRRLGPAPERAHARWWRRIRPVACA